METPPFGAPISTRGAPIPVYGAPTHPLGSPQTPRGTPTSPDPHTQLREPIAGGCGRSRFPAPLGGVEGKKGQGGEGSCCIALHSFSFPASSRPLPLFLAPFPPSVAQGRSRRMLRDAGPGGAGPVPKVNKGEGKGKERGKIGREEEEEGVVAPWPPGSPPSSPQGVLGEPWSENGVGAWRFLSSRLFFFVFWVWCFLFLACTLWRAGLGPGRSGGYPLILHTG